MLPFPTFAQVIDFKMLYVQIDEMMFLGYGDLVQPTRTLLKRGHTFVGDLYHILVGSKMSGLKNIIVYFWRRQIFNNICALSSKLSLKDVCLHGRERVSKIETTVFIIYFASFFSTVRKIHHHHKTKRMSKQNYNNPSDGNLLNLWHPPYPFDHHHQGPYAHPHLLPNPNQNGIS